MANGNGPQMGHRLPLSAGPTRQQATQESEEAAAAFIAEHRDTKASLRMAEDANQGLKIQLQDLLRENEELRQKLKISEERTFFLQGYAIELTTCLDILKSSNVSIIDRAIKRAHDSGIKARQSEISAQQQVDTIKPNGSALPASDWGNGSEAK